MDVLWFKLPRKDSDPDESFGRIAPGRMLAMIDRGAYWQCGCVIPKGGAEELRQKGIDAFRASIAHLTPFLADRVDTLKDWTDVSLLTVQVNRLKKWSRPGLLCIGDAAHAMSPVGGVGVNLAIQDAVAAANLLGAKLRDNSLSDADVSRGAAATGISDARHAGDSAFHPRSRGAQRARGARSRWTRRWRCGCSTRYRCCVACRRGSWGSACGPSISKPDARHLASRIKAPKARGPSPVSALPRTFSVCASSAQSSFENQLAT